VTDVDKRKIRIQTQQDPFHRRYILIAKSKIGQQRHDPSIRHSFPGKCKVSPQQNYWRLTTDDGL